MVTSLLWTRTVITTGTDVGIEKVPLADIMLREIIDASTLLLLDIYLDAIHDAVVQIFEDTPWLLYDAAASLFDSGFKMYHEREHGFVCLRKPALQRLIRQCLEARTNPTTMIHIPIKVRFLLPDVAISKPCQAPIMLRSTADRLETTTHVDATSMTVHNRMGRVVLPQLAVVKPDKLPMFSTNVERYYHDHSTDGPALSTSAVFENTGKTSLPIGGFTVKLPYVERTLTSLVGSTPDVGVHNTSHNLVDIDVSVPVKRAEAETVKISVNSHHHPFCGTALLHTFMMNASASVSYQRDPSCVLKDPNQLCLSLLMRYQLIDRGCLSLLMRYQPIDRGRLSDAFSPT
jgi:hypothetical protein